MPELDAITIPIDVDTSGVDNGFSEAVTISQRSAEKMAMAIKSGFGKMENTIRSTMGKIRSTISKGFQKTITGIKDAVFNLKSAFAALGLGVVGKQFIDAASTSEQFQIRLNALLGSVEEGNKVFKDMSQFAAGVAFEYEEIMGAATQLSGIVKGGSKEISELMPLIADLATVSGLSIQTTTEQISRMFSAGAASADLFRERGITAMLGFQSGVAVSAEETRKRVMEAWTKQGSQFRDASAKMATTWTGLMSMLSDKWFQFRNIVSDAGVFNFLKAIVIVIDKELKSAIEGSEKQATGWANSIIDGIKFAMRAVAVFQSSFKGVKLVWLGLKLVFSNMIVAILEDMQKAVNAVNKIKGFFGLDPSGQALIELTDVVKNQNAKIRKEFKSTADEKSALALMEERIKSIQNVADQLDLEGVTGAQPGIALPSGEMGAAPQQKAALQSQRDAAIAAREQLVTDLATDTELINQAWIARLEQIKLLRSQGLIDAEQAHMLEQRASMIHNDELTKIEKKAQEDRQRIQQLALRSSFNSLSSILGSISSLMGTENKKQFELGKKFAIAQAIIDTISAAQSAYASAAKIPGVGFVLAPIAAAAATLAGVARVNKIRGTSFGGGGSASGAGGGGAVATGGGGGTIPTQQPSVAPIGAPTANQLDLNLVLQDEDGVMSTAQVRKLIEQIDEQIQDGATLSSVQLSTS